MSVKEVVVVYILELAVDAGEQPEFLRYVGGDWGPDRMPTQDWTKAETHTTPVAAIQAGVEYRGHAGGTLVRKVRIDTERTLLP